MNTYLTIKEERDWNYFITRSLRYDAYHLWQYHAIDSAGEPVMFVYLKDDLFIALPLIKRKIADSSWFDFASVYGYVGPVSNQEFADITDDIVSDLQMSFLEFMKSEQSVSVFSRLHPFINQHNLLDKIGGVIGNGKTVYVDLTVPHEEQESHYDRKLAKQIRNLRKKNYDIIDSSDKQAIRLFSEMYTENMTRVAATGNYFFQEEYFRNLLEKNQGTSKLLMVYDNGVPIGGALILYSNDIIRQHLSATSANYLKESPSKLITDEVSLLGRRLGAKYYHMGGGVGGREDSLYKFKASFSKLTLDDYTWRFIADHNAYNSLVELRGLSKNTESDFFPLYRSKIAEVVH